MGAEAAVTSDAIIYLPGIMGSELVNADGKVLWGAKVGTLLRQVFFRDVFERIEPRPNDGIRASRPIALPAMIPFLSAMEPYTKLEKRLQNIALRPEAVIAYPYDWRNPVASAASGLVEVARSHLATWRVRFATLDADVRKGLPDPQLTLVGHSMGGLVASWYMTHFEDYGASDVRRLITLGTPFRGSLSAVKVIATGDKLPLGLYADSLRRSAQKMPGLYELIARYNALDEPGGSQPRRLRPSDIADIGGSLDLATAAFENMDALMNKVDDLKGERLHCLTGSSQPTLQSVSISAGVPTFAEEVTDADGYRADFGGDGTVFRYASTPTGITGSPIPQTHGALAKTTEGTDFAASMATLRKPGAFQGAADLGVRAPDIAEATKAFEVQAMSGEAASLTCQVHNAETGAMTNVTSKPVREGIATIPLKINTPGLYRISIAVGGFSPVQRLVLVVENERS